MPNPVWYYHLAHEIATGWAEFERISRGSPLSLSWPRRDHTGHRAVTYRMSHKQAGTYRLWRRAGHRYVLKADVGRFYHSIYTHSVPWALHGKAWAKQNQRTFCLGNEVDRHLRNAQDGQTIGIPIGPDTSFIVADALLASLDRLINRDISTRGIRFVDEWEFGFPGLAGAERAAAVIEEHLATYELGLNPNKTRILEGPVSLEDTWITALKQVTRPTGSTFEQDYIHTLFDLAFELASEPGSQGILNWVVSTLIPGQFHWAAWRSAQPLLLQCAASEPGTLPRCLKLFWRARGAGHVVNSNRLHETLSTIISHAARRAHWNEVAWALWGHLLFDLPIDADDFKHVLGCDDTIVALVALDAIAKGFGPAAADLSVWASRMVTDGLDDRDWLLVYEASVKGWLPTTPNPVQADVDYKFLADNGISFYRDGSPAGELMQSNAWSGPAWMAPHLGYAEAAGRD